MKKLPDGWKKVELSEILESIENGNRPKGGITDLKDGIPSIGGEHINSTGGFNLKNVRLIPYDFYSSMKRGKIQREDVLVVKDGATTGKVSFVGSDFPYEDAAVNEHVFILRGKKDLVHQKFLFYHLYSPIGQRQMDANFHGAAIGGINTQFVKNYNLILPPLPTQKKIAAVLEKAEKLREWRKEADGLTERLLKSTFLDMFGDPIENQKGFDFIQLKNVYSKVKSGTKCGPFGSALKKHEYVNCGIPVWTMDNIYENRFIEDGCLYITEEKYQQLKPYFVEKGDILISRAGTVGKMCVANPSIYPSIIGTNLIRLSLDCSKIEPIYFTCLMTYCKDRMRRLKTGDDDAYSFMNTGVLNDIRIPLPPLALQQKFASIVQRVEQIRQHQKESKQQIDHFFNVLVQRAFQGELEAK